MADLPELRSLDVAGAMNAGQQNALRGMQLQQMMRESERKNKLEELMRGVDWSKPEQALRTIGQYIDPAQAMALSSAVQKAQKEAKVMDMVNSLMRGGAVDAMNAGGAGPTVAAANAGIGRINPLALPGLSMLGDSGKAAGDMLYKLMTPHNTPEGSVSRDLLGNMIENPKLGEGQMAQRAPGGAFMGARLTPNYLSNLGQIEDVREAAKARYNFRDVPVGGGAAAPMSVLDLANRQKPTPMASTDGVLRGEGMTDAEAKTKALAAADLGLPHAFSTGPAAGTPGRTETTYEKERSQKQAEADVARSVDKPKDQARLAEIGATLNHLANSADKVLNHKGLKYATGLSGIALRRVPGQPAYDAAVSLESLKSQISIAALAKMREDSKTGGALGNVSNYEDQMLANSIASLQEAQSEKQLRESLSDVKKWANAAKARRESAFNLLHGTPQDASGSTGGWAVVK